MLAWCGNRAVLAWAARRSRHSRRTAAVVIRLIMCILCSMIGFAASIPRQFNTGVAIRALAMNTRDIAPGGVTQGVRRKQDQGDGQPQ